jgi:di/tricarboxylate transporter
MLGFGNEALITICLLLIIAKGVEISGALRPVGRVLARLWLFNRTLALLATLVVAAFVSAFANNTPIVVMLLPILVGVAHRIGMPPSRMLMPVGFATIIGGMSTTIGTSTNLLVVSVSRQLGGPRFEMFDFMLPASIAAAAGILYLWTIAPRLLPDRASPLAGSAPRIFHSVIDVNDDSPFAGQTLADVMRLMEGQIRIERVQRGAGLELVRLPSLQLRAGDRLHVRGTPEAIKKIQNSFGGGFEESDLLRAPEQRLVEIVVTPDSRLHRKRLSELRGATLGKLFPVGLHRPGYQGMMPIEESGDPVLDTGDVLLMQGRKQDIQELKDKAHLLILDRTIQVPRTAKAPLAIAVLLAVVLAAALGIVPIMVSALCGVGIMLVGRGVAWDEAWSALDTRLVLVIVTSLALGTSLSVTGAADFLARSFVGAMQDLPPAVVISSLLLVTALLTEVVTNNAVAVIATPIAISVANQLDLSPTPFVLAVLFGSNMSYLTPIGYQTNLLVFSAGGYKFADFFRAGIPLQVLLWAVLSIILPMLYL